ncbi:MAG: bifunctional metallophosphatase/5'-nucleotidase, partial [Erysipelotrichaceae bacterium]|nr:bifunctional metallophosphatase/5'-nucleotidase [Erysipelotrichaceae bacterium]
MKFRLLVSSDVHGTVMPYRYSDLKPCDHGFLKVKATMKKCIDENTVIIDNGDILEGSPLLSYHYRYEKDEKNPMLSCTENFVDYFNIGNHDFNNGPEELFDYISKSTGTCICGNIRYHDVPIGKEYVIHTLKDGTRLAFIGACTQYIPNWEKPENIEGFSFEDACVFFQRMCRKVKEEERPDVLIAVYHGGYEKDFEGRELIPDTGENEAYRIAESVPEIDILITGHLHLSIAGTLFGKPTSQTRPNGVEFALIDYDTDAKTGEVKLIPSTAEADPKELSSFEEIEKRVSKWLDSPMGRVRGTDLRIKDEEEARLHKHPLVSFLNQVEKEVTGAELASTAIFSGAIGFPQEITIRDIVSTYVYPNTLVMMEIDGKILKEYLERCAEYFKEEDGKIVPS